MPVCIASGEIICYAFSTLGGVLVGCMLKFADSNLIWIDLEMTGLDPALDRIIEIATIVTDDNLLEVEEGPVLAIHQPDSVLDGMDDWNTSHHNSSGLVQRVRDSRMSAEDAQRLTLDFLQQYVPANASPICGNSVHQDKRFLYNEMPLLAQYFHYRHLDVTSVKILAERWCPGVIDHVKKRGEHRALADIYDSINELKTYREYFLNLEKT